MIKTLALIKRRDDIERDAFRHHYEETHVPLALPILEGLIRYVRYHVVQDRIGEVDFDVLTFFGYRDKGATDGVFARLESSEGEAIHADERTFMDTAANRFFAVSERMLLDAEEGEEGETHLFVLVRRPPGMSRFDASAQLVSRHYPALLAGFEKPSFARLLDGFPMQGDPLETDSVLQVAATTFDGLEGWSKELARGGFRVVAVETQRFETPLGG